MSYNRIESLGVHSLANSDFGRRLKVLNLRDTSIDNIGMNDFSTYHLDKLESIDFSDNLISDIGIEALALSNVFPNINQLILNNNHIRDDGIYALCQSEMFCNLESLFLANNFKERGLL